MRLMLFITSFLLLQGYLPCNATGFEWDQNGVLPLEVANEGPTRIFIEGEKIMDIFAYPEGAAKLMLHPSGCLFVIPEEGATELHLTIMGEGGHSQDMRLKFVKKRPGPVSLHTREVPPYSSKESKSQTTNSHQ